MNGSRGKNEEKGDKEKIKQDKRNPPNIFLPVGAKLIFSGRGGGII